jgi:ectoine hydroxylase-related dioxygenase (phytanoyl-CoA dioxygenase family)
MNYLEALSNSKQLKELREELAVNGFSILSNAYSQEFCDKIIQFMDNCEADNQKDNKPFHGLEINYGGSELRIWDAQNRHNDIKMFYHHSNIVMSRILNKDAEAFTLLAIRNQQLLEDKDKYLKNRWHLDSFRKQLKIFLFLTDTHIDSGPLEFIPGTHSKKFKFSAFIRGKIIRLRDFLSNGQRAYQRLEDSWVDGLAKDGFSSTPLICKAGTLAIVDTSVIHRARPCLEGSRYALTAYF